MVDDVVDVDGSEEGMVVLKRRADSRLLSLAESSSECSVPHFSATFHFRRVPPQQHQQASKPA
jgi:hypothetical protein